MTAIQLAAIIAAYVLALARLFNAGKWAWEFLPKPAQPLLPAFVLLAPTLAEQLAGVKTGLDLAELGLLALGAMTTAIRGTQPAKVGVFCVLVAFHSQACAGWKPFARDASDVARNLCGLFFAEKQGLSLEDAARQFCVTRDQLDPWLEEILRAKATAGKSSTQGTP
jgi:hypothetical protein